MAGSTECSACPGGRADVDMNPATACVSCVAGQYSASNVTSCTDCASGWADLDSNAATPCTACDAGYFADVVGRRAIYVKLGRRTWTVVRAHRVSHASLARTRAEAM